jgi:6-phosphogluconolactonase (cycloisomerase 2 family)
VAVRGSLVYVLDSAGVSGFRLGPGGLAPIEGSRRPLSADGADGAQAGFAPDGRTLVVTERGTNRISTYGVRADGTLDGPVAVGSAGVTPYGFDFAPDGTLVVTEAFGGETGKAATSSYALGADGAVPASASVRNTRSEVCWAAVTPDGRFAYVTNFGDGTISSYAISPDGSIRLLEAVAASTRLGEKGVRDEALTPDGRFLYALDADSREIHGWSVGTDGDLVALGAVDGLPSTAAGLAAV